MAMIELKGKSKYWKLATGRKSPARQTKIPAIVILRAVAIARRALKNAAAAPTKRAKKITEGYRLCAIHQLCCTGFAPATIRRSFHMGTRLNRRYAEKARKTAPNPQKSPFHRALV